MFENSAEGGYYTYTTFVQYEESIYMGYRYYDTAYDLMEESEGTEAADAWYKGWEDESAIQIGSVTDAEDTGVVYPFDYGLSYTEFEWEITESNMDVDTKGTIQLTVNVTNTGDHAGKDVVELYYTAPYSQGGIEKSTVVLGAFAKTDIIQPGESDEVTLSLAVEDMASYDENHENSDGTTGCYVLDEGEYTLSLRTDSHYAVDDTVAYDSEENKRQSDSTVATNAFTEDLSQRSPAMVDMTRSDWGNTPGEGSFPTEATDEDRVMSDELRENLLNKTAGGISMNTGEPSMTGFFDPESEGYIRCGMTPASIGGE